jgi:hypothetical protein
MSHGVEIKTSKTQDYSQYSMSEADYEFIRVLPQTGGLPFTAAAQQGVQAVFDVPQQCINLSRSYLKWTQTPDASAVANTVNWAYEKTVGMISYLKFESANGQTLVELTQPANYLELVLPLHMTKDDLTNNDPASQYPHKIHSAGAASEVLTSAGQRVDNTAADQPYAAFQYLQQGTAQGPDPVKSPMVPLGVYKDTLLGQDKTHYFGEMTKLTITLGPNNRAMWTTLSVTDPSLVPLETKTNTVISSLQLFLCVENNIVKQQKIMDRVKNHKFKEVVPYVYCNRFVVPATTTSPILQQRYSNSNGFKLKRIICAPFNGASEVKNTMYEHTNLARTKLTNLYTEIDGVMKQRTQTNCSNGEDFLRMQKFLKGTPLGYSRALYEYNWVWIDDWTGIASPKDDLKGAPEDNLIDGLELGNKETLWTLTATATGTIANIWYVFAIGLKTLVIDSSGPRLENKYYAPDEFPSTA